MLNALRRLSVESVNTALSWNRFKLVGNPKNRFGASKKQEAIIGHQGRNFFKNGCFGFLIKIDQNVAAEYDVKLPQARK